MATSVLASRAIGRNELELTFGIPLTDFDAAALNETLDLGTIPAYAIIREVILEKMVSAAHPTATSVAVEIGTSADPDAFVTSTSILSAGPTRTWTPTAAGPYAPVADVALKAKVTADANLGNGTASSFTAGYIAVRVIYRALPLLTA
jgi:hypothetical protein